MRGSPHLHALIWISPQYVLMREDKNTVIHRIYRQPVQAYLPNKDTEPYSMSRLQCIKSIIPLEHAGNTEIYNAGLMLVSFSQAVFDDLCEEVKTRRACY